MNRIIIALLLGIIGFMAVKNNNIDLSGFFSLTNTQEIVDEMSPIVAQAFDDAESDHIEKKVIDDEVEGIHPDPEKCVCKGTGIYIAGDGHRSVCPYHGSKQQKAAAEAGMLDEFVEKQHSHDHAQAVDKIETGEVVVKNDSYKIKVLTSRSCKKCDDMIANLSAQLAQSGYTMGQSSSHDLHIVKLEDDRVGYINLENAVKKFQSQRGIRYSRQWPIFVEIENGFITSVRVGTQSYQQVINRYKLEN